MSDFSTYVTEEIQVMIPEYQEEAFDDLQLKPQEILFVYKYVSDGFDGIQAYKDAFGVEHRAALASSKKLLARKDIQTAYNRLLDLIWAEACNILPIQLLSDMNKIRDLDPLDYYDDSGEPRPLSSIPEDKRKLINNVEIMLDRMGGVHYRYDLPDKRKVTSTMLEIIKLRDQTGSKGEEIADMRETKALVKSIFAEVLDKGK